MEEKQKSIVFSCMADRKESLTAAGCITILFAVCICLLWMDVKSSGDIFFIVFMGIIGVGVDAVFIWLIVPTVTINRDGITLRFGKIVIRHIAADEIQTIVKTRINGRIPFYPIRILTTPAEMLEAKGEQRLYKRRLIRNELKFRRNKSDWKDLCLREGLSLTGGLWMEFTPERKQLLQEMFPNAAFREAKQYNDPPSLT